MGNSYTRVLRFKGSINLVCWDRPSCSGRDTLYVLWGNSMNLHACDYRRLRSIAFEGQQMSSIIEKERKRSRYLWRGANEGSGVARP
jgi:hypothetical protein